MYRAELHGKFSPEEARSEDILTSDIFSYFMYSNRAFLTEYLNDIGIPVSIEEAEAAEFVFWPSYDDQTEPDVIILVGDWYLLFEAKYMSGFGKETDRLKFQPVREIEGGQLEAKALGKANFKFIAITADYCYQSRKFKQFDEQTLKNLVIWTNWQKVASSIRRVLESGNNLTNPERSFATDLLELLEKKKLRSYDGERLDRLRGITATSKSIFLDAATIEFRGEFSGFVTALESEQHMASIAGSIFSDK